jgi:hypothetical protein
MVPMKTIYYIVIIKSDISVTYAWAHGLYEHVCSQYDNIGDMEYLKKCV